MNAWWLPVRSRWWAWWQGWLATGAHTGTGAAMLAASDGLRRSLPDVKPAAAMAFCGVVILYSVRYLHSAMDGRPGARERWMRRYPKSTCAVILLASLGAPAAAWHCDRARLAQVMIAGVAGLAYCFPLFGVPLRRFGTLKPAILAASWWLVTSPVVADGEAGALAARFFGLFGLCLLFDLKDMEGDRAAGLRTPAVILGESSLRLLAGQVFVIGAILATITGAYDLLSEIGCLVVLGFVATRRKSLFRVVAVGDGAMIAAGVVGVLLNFRLL